MRFSFAILIITLLAACNRQEQQPQFRSVYQLQISGTAKKTSKIKGSFAFYNPDEKNNWTFVSLMSDIYANGKDIGTFVYTDNVLILPASEFKVPLLYSVDTDKLPLKEDSTGESLAIRMKGHALLANAKGDKIKVFFDHTETVNVIIQRESRKEERDERREERKLRKELRKQQKEQLKLERVGQ